MAFALALFNALAALPGILGYLERFASGVMLWYMRNAKEKTLAGIADAAAAAARANTQEERHAALDLWRAALSRPRILP